MYLTHAVKTAVKTVDGQSADLEGLQAELEKTNKLLSDAVAERDHAQGEVKSAYECRDRALTQLRDARATASRHSAELAARDD